MSKLEKKLQLRQSLLKKFESLKQLIGFCIRMQTYYYQNNNAVMHEIMNERIQKVVNEIERVSIILKPLNDLARLEYQKTPVAQFLKNSQGLNGRQILMAAKNLGKS